MDVSRLRERDPWAFRLGVLLLCLLAVWPIWFAAGGLLGVFRFGGGDFTAYYLTGLRVWNGLPIYGTDLVGAVPEPRSIRFLYPPVVAAPFALLPLLDLLAARVVFLLSQFGFLWASVLVLLRAWNVRLSRGRVLAVGWLLAGVQPVVFLLRIGNVNGFVAGFLCLSAAVTIAPASRDRPFLGGVLATVAALPKPYVAPAGAHLFGDRRRLLGAGLAAVGFALAGVLLFGLETTRAYLDVLTAGEAWGVPRPPHPLASHYRPFGWFVTTRGLVQAGILVLALTTALVAREADRDDAFAMGCVTVPLVAPSADTLTLLIAVPGLLVLGIREIRRDGHPAIVFAAAVLLQTGVYLVRVLTNYGPRYVSSVPWDVLRELVILHPATLGLLPVFGLCVGRVWAGRDFQWVERVTARGP